LDLALGEDADEGRGQRTVLREHDGLRVDPVGSDRVGVMVEERLLDGGVERDRLELAEPGGARRLEDDQPADGIELESRDLDHGLECVGVQAIEVAHVAIERTHGDHRARVQMSRGQHRAERVEVRVPVGGDDLLGPHGLILPRESASHGRHHQVTRGTYASRGVRLSPEREADWPKTAKATANFRDSPRHAASLRRQ
jgi:hypothetical protein